MPLSTKDRVESYQELSNFRLMAKLPVILTINGRSFSKLSSLIDKPYCPKFGECLYSTAIRLCSEIDGVVFGYVHGDDITLVLRNDQTNDTLPWCNNQINKITSIASSVASLHFNKCAAALDLNIVDPTFISTCFTVPNLSEAINTIIYKQQQNFYTSIQFACFYEMIKKFDKQAIKDMLSGLSFDDKVQLLKQECDVDYYQYPTEFRRGVALYKIPKVYEGNMKFKWHVNYDLPIFTKEQSFLSAVFK